MRDLTLHFVKCLSFIIKIMERTGGSTGVQNLGALESALAQPRMSFAGEELYPTLIEKASALGFTLIKNHPFWDGNKRIGHAAMETFLVLNGHEIDATTEDQEQVVLQVASGALGRKEFTDWLGRYVIVRRQS